MKSRTHFETIDFNLQFMEHWNCWPKTPQAKNVGLAGFGSGRTCRHSCAGTPADIVDLVSNA